MRNVVALAVGLALAYGVWSLGVAPGDTTGGTSEGVPPALVSRPNPVGTPVLNAPDIPIPTHSEADLEAALPEPAPPSPVVSGGSSGGGRIEEDDPRWNCATMGNRSCG